MSKKDKQRPSKSLLDFGVEESPSIIRKRLLKVKRKATGPRKKQFPVQKEIRDQINPITHLCQTDKLCEESLAVVCRWRDKENERIILLTLLWSDSINQKLESFELD
ncbi:hypothetical protein TNCV_3708981 [Trichonephila clavipes]|nr:hypothetical protein TNCV_3708981 [Trichonephila clavipes]